MDRLFVLASEVAPLVTGQWRYNHLAEKRSEVRHANEAVLNDDTPSGNGARVTIPQHPQRSAWSWYSITVGCIGGSSVT